MHINFEVWCINVIRQKKKRLFAYPPQLFQEGVGRSVFGGLFLFVFPSFSHKISVGRSGKLFKTFYFLKNFLRSGDKTWSVGRGQASDLSFFA